jgi:prefoldin alpha subunit
VRKEENKMVNEEEVFRKMISELEFLQGTARILQTRIGMIESAIQELYTTDSTLEGLKYEKKGSAILMPIGGGSYVKAKISDSKKVIFGIGANIATEKTVEEAQESIGERTIELQKGRTSIQQQLNEVITKINDLQNQIRSMAQPARRENSVRAA